MACCGSPVSKTCSTTCTLTIERTSHFKRDYKREFRGRFRPHPASRRRVAPGGPAGRARTFTVRRSDHGNGGETKSLTARGQAT